MLADQLDTDPVIAKTWIFKQPVAEFISRVPATNLDKDVLVAVVVQVRERDSVPLL